MCGIAGILGKNDRELLGKMCDSLAHRGPDDAGVYCDEIVSLGMRRLTIIDLETGHQPLSNETKTVWVIFNGEIYNYVQIKELLEKKGHIFSTRTDTEVLVHLYEEYGESFTEYLRGMFACVLYDKEKQKVLLVRDRLGIKPLYYRQQGHLLYFASELKALLKDHSFKKTVNNHAVMKFLKFLYVPSPMTIYEDVYKLPAAHMLIWHNGTVTVKKYWKLSFKKRYFRKQDIIVQLKHLLQEVVSLRLMSDVPLGAFLSGGLDSGTVVALMTRASAAPVKTFSIGYERAYASYNETDAARKLAEHFGCDHTEHIIAPDAVDLTRSLVRHFDEPFADSSAIPTYLVSKAAREKVTVALSGIGGDEVFGGYPRYQGIKVSRYYEKLPLPVRQWVYRLACTLAESTQSRNIRGWIKRFARGGVRPIVERYFDWVTFDHAFIDQGMYSEQFFDSLTSTDMTAPMGLWLQGDLLDAVFHVDTQTYLIDDLLVMGDRMSMAHSLELRVPFCDHMLIEFMAAIPADIRFPGLKRKALLIEAMKHILPDELFTRPKQGFMVPLGEWIKGPIKPLVRELLNKEQTAKRGYLKPEKIQWMIEQHESGHENFTDQIWALMNLELWHQAYVD